jgi:rubrerythrin
MIACEECGYEFDPVATRWLCPSCGRKHHCCD